MWKGRDGRYTTVRQKERRKEMANRPFSRCHPPDTAIDGEQGSTTDNKKTVSTAGNIHYHLPDKGS